MLTRVTGVRLDSLNTTILEYFYGQDGVAGIVYEGQKYYFRRNIQGDVTHIYTIDGRLKACYTYDAWGNHKVYDASGNVNTNPNFIGNVNPFRYRGYYYDRETGLYYCKSRYYDPEVCRWINADSIEYLDPETINGLNLYAYCGNNPVMYIDPNGHFFISFLITSIIIGAVAGGAINGVKAYNDGQRGAGLVGAIVGGAVMGGAMGAVMAIGGAAGLASIGVGVAGFGMTTAAAFGVSLAIGVGAGIASYSIENGIRSDREWTVGGFFLSGAMGGLQAATTFGIAFAGGRAGLFTNKLTAMTASDFMMHVFNATGKVTMGQSVVYATQLLLSNTITRFILATLPGASLRFLIEKLIKGG